MLKKSTNDFNMYLICASILLKGVDDNNVSDSSNENSVTLSEKAQMYVLDEFETNNMVIDQLVQLLDAMASDEWMGVISSHKFVEVDQVNRDKATLKVVMEHYAIANRFQIKIQRSNAIRYTQINVPELFYTNNNLIVICVNIYTLMHYSCYIDFLKIVYTRAVTRLCASQISASR